MTGELDVDYVLLRDRIRYLSELSERLGDEVENIAGYTERLDIFWDGDANASYMLSVADDLAVCAAIMLRIRKVIRAADEAFSVYMANEDRVRTVIEEYGMKRR